MPERAQQSQSLAVDPFDPSGPPTCMPSDGDGEPLIRCVVAGSGASAGTVISKTLTR
jgi:hypothetical protein